MNLAAASAVMSDHGWLSRRPAAFRDDVINRCRIRRYSAYESIYREGDTSNCMFGLAAGRWFVKVPPAETMITLASPGFWIGEAGIFRGVERAASVIAATDSVVLYLAPADFAELAANAEYCRHFAANTAEALAEAIAVIGNLSQPRADIRVAQRLATLQIFNASEREPDVQLSQTDLAELCNLSRTTLGGVLRMFVKRGFLRLAYRQIVIVDLPALIDFAFNDDAMWR